MTSTPQLGVSLGPVLISWMAASLWFAGGLAVLFAALALVLALMWPTELAVAAAGVYVAAAFLSYGEYQNEPR